MRPAELAAFSVNAKKLTDAEKNTLAQEFQSIAARPEELRECDQNGQLIFRPLSAHDDRLLAGLSKDWQSVPRVIGEAILKSDPRNPLPEIFLAARLQALIKDRQVEEKPEKR